MGQTLDRGVAPVSPTVRVGTDVLDRLLGAVGEVILSSRQLRSSISPGAVTASLDSALHGVERRVSELQRRALELRTTSMSRVLDHLPRTAYQIAEKLGKTVEVELLGGELEIDRSILDRLGEPLLHLVRNAIDHGLESSPHRVSVGKVERGRLVIEARRVREAIQVVVRDDGQGIDLEAVRSQVIRSGRMHPDLAEDLPPQQLAPLIFEAGLSTASEVSEFSGRGVGMEVVKKVAESLGGQVEIETQPGQGTEIVLTVPISAAVQSALIVEVGAERLALPIHRIERVLEVDHARIEEAGVESFVVLEDHPVPVLDLASIVRVPRTQFSGSKARLVLVELKGERVGLRVDGFAGQHEIYVKPIPDWLSSLRLLAGLTLLEDGRPVFLLDVNQLA